MLLFLTVYRNTGMNGKQLETLFEPSRPNVMETENHVQTIWSSINCTQAWKDG